MTFQKPFSNYHNVLKRGNKLKFTTYKLPLKHTLKFPKNFLLMRNFLEICFETSEKPKSNLQMIEYWH